MAITPHYGSLTQNSVSITATGTNQDSLVVGISEIKDTLVTRNTLNADRFSACLGSMAQYAAGTRIYVDYYRQIENADINKNTVSDAPGTESGNHRVYTLIKNMVMVLEGSIDPSYDTEKAFTSVTGEGFILPGIFPRSGDLFIYTIPDDQVGLFRITSVGMLAPLSHNSGSKVSFTLDSYANDGDLAKLNSQLNAIYYFDGDVLTTDGSALLTTDKYVQKGTLESLRKNLIDLYYKMFYLSGYSSFLRPDGIYDPYLVDFIQRTITVREAGRRPVQLLERAPNLEQSIWDRLLFRSNRTVANVATSFYLARFGQSLLGTRLTPLINRHFILLKNMFQLDRPSRNFSFGGPEQEVVGIDEEGKDIVAERCYVLSRNFYEETLLEMTDIEQLLYLVITQGKMDIDKLIEIMSKMENKTPDALFYEIPICLYLQSRAASLLVVKTQGA